jgi:hypothetical protein
MEPMGHQNMKWIIVVLAGFLCLADAAQAQWVFIGRKALGAVNRLVSQGHEKEGPGYEVATVLLEADADKVYGTAADLLKENPQARITYRDDPSRTIEFTDGKIWAGIKVSRFEEKISQILIGATAVSGKPGGASVVVQKILRVCEKMEIPCSLAKD